MFEPSTDNRTRGHSFKLKKHSSRLDLRKYFFFERVVNRWNELDEDTISATTIKMFKNRLQRFRQLKTSFYTDTCSSRPRLEGEHLLLVRPHQIIHHVNRIQRSGARCYTVGPIGDSRPLKRGRTCPNNIIGTHDPVPPVHQVHAYDA